MKTNKTKPLEALYGEFPWMAAILLATGEGPPHFLCGGTLIQHDVVLTAAHCLHNKVRINFHQELSYIYSVLSQVFSSMRLYFTTFVHSSPHLLYCPR